MKKLLPIVAILAVIGAGFVFLNSKKNQEGNGFLKTDEDSAFSGALDLAFKKGIPLNCTWDSPDGTKISAKIKGKKYYGEIAQGDRKSAVVIVNECMWTWSEDTQQGVKMCFDSDPWEEGEMEKPDNVYCVPGVFGDDVFTPPSDMNFLDMNAMVDFN